MIGRREYHGCCSLCFLTRAEFVACLGQGINLHIVCYMQFLHNSCHGNICAVCLIFVVLHHHLNLVEMAYRNIGIGILVDFVYR